jgi:hypothetical protein
VDHAVKLGVSTQERINIEPHTNESTEEAIQHVKQSIKLNLPPHIFKSLQEEIQGVNTSRATMQACVSDNHLATSCHTHREEFTPVVEPPRSQR